ncbi:Basic 7s globulin [Quillaja saponaria]|uniref:Basic 7s globulin n=1 Tax=Quillaja saponaria TaxID=32244 RepID=A0AAD7PHC9_QUISA|nr:Basic 7s globulin [Quillaja saponaria]
MGAVKPPTGTPIVTNPHKNFISLVIDLGGRFPWFDCSGYDSTTYRPTPCGSKRCKISKGPDCINCNRPLKPGCTNNNCDEIDGKLKLTEIEIPRFQSACVDPNKFGVTGLLDGLVNGSRGVLGLGRTPISFPAQLASTFNLPNKFALCLPSHNAGFGDILVGEGPYRNAPRDLSKLIATTSLVINPHSTGPIFDDTPSQEYFIDVKSIKIDGEVVNLNTSLLAIDKNGNGGSSFSTVNPYTVLQTSIYKASVGEFVKKAASKKIKRVKSEGQFGACFDSRTIANTITGPAVPNIDLVLQNENVYWRICGANSMVKVKKNVLCLAFVDGGSEEEQLKLQLFLVAISWRIHFWNLIWLPQSWGSPLHNMSRTIFK